MTMAEQPSPSFRKLAGICLILLLIALWAALVASLSPIVSRWPILVQAPFYLFMGLVWIVPLKPMVRWMESGRWSDPDR
jgi:predicted membrane channel-forming protein YqfA (hemolysin III family)